LANRETGRLNHAPFGIKKTTVTITDVMDRH
jgi:hypothetical protein